MTLPSHSSSSPSSSQVNPSTNPPVAATPITSLLAAANNNNNNNNDHRSVAADNVNMITNYVSFLSNICGALKQLKRTGWIRHQVPLPESDCDHMHRCAMCAMLVMSSLQQQQDQQQQTQEQQHQQHGLLDGTKLLKMALTHDLCEALAGDITPHCDANLILTKHDRERAAMEQIRELLNNSLGVELHDLWQEYEQQSSLEAIYCKDIDKFEMVLQAYEYEKQHLQPRRQQQQEQLQDDNNDEQVVESQQGRDVTVSNPDDYLNQSVQHHPLRGFFISTNAAMKTAFFRQLDGEVRRQREAMLHERGWNVTDQERQQPVVSTVSTTTTTPTV